MSDYRPTPPVPTEVDLRDFQYMELDVRVLRDSRFAAQVSGDAFRAGVLLWCAAWHQVPCSSLPDDDIELANLAGYGRFHKEWRKVREEALQGFVKCSDGRLYHKAVAEKAMTAWTSKLKHHYERARDRLRKANKAAVTAGREQAPEISFEQWNAQRMAAGVPMESADASAGIPQKVPAGKPGIPAENALRGNGEGTERRGNGEGTDYVLLSGGPALAPPAPVPPPPADPAPPPAPTAPRSARAPKPKSDGSVVWSAYSTAYADRYGTQPVRNAKTNSVLATLVERLGAEDAPRVAAFFVAHQRMDYVRATHTVDLLLRDAEGLRTQWATGRQTTQAQAVQADRTQTNASAFAPLIAEAKAREAQQEIL